MQKVSIYIPVYNGEKTIKEVIDSVKFQSFSFDEVIVINDCSTDNTGEILSTFSEIKIINNKDNKGLSHCRNVAINETRNEIVAAIDADVVLDKYWLENIIKNLKDDTVMCGGNLSEKYINNNYNNWRSVNYMQNWGNEDTINPSFLYGCNTIQLKNIWKKIGGYDEKLKSNGEDIDYSRRIKNLGNYDLFYNSNAKCLHLQNDDLKSISKRVWRYHSYGYKIKKPSFYRFVKLIIKQFKFFILRSIKNLIKLNFIFIFINFVVLINFIKLEFVRTIKKEES
tara:strand:- start:63 stop:908 length:846 start_codon:yes stop_codon:yes gene_type:complete